MPRQLWKFVALSALAVQVRHCLWESDSCGMVSRRSFDFDEVNAAELDIPCLASELEQQLLETESQQRKQAVCDSYRYFN